jgi:hypothetical protein
VNRYELVFRDDIVEIIGRDIHGTYFDLRLNVDQALGLIDDLAHWTSTDETSTSR